MSETVVEGIGGVFLESNDAATLADWYHRRLGIDFHLDGDSRYVVFRTRDLHTGIIRESPVFAIVQSSKALAPSDLRGFTVNLRVADLDLILERLSTAGIAVEEDRVVWEGGKHGWIRDLDGNRIELFEETPLAPDSPYRTASPTE